MTAFRLLRTVALLSIAASSPALAEDTQPQPWPLEKAWAWSRHQPWPCGFNFVPSTAANTTELWQAESFDEKTIDRELGWARGVGYNTCRMFVQFLVWKHDPQGLTNRMDRLLALANRNGLSVLPVLFDDCMFGDPPQSEPYLGKQREPIPGMIGSSWTPSPGHKAVTDRAVWPDLERYVKDLTTAFGRDKRVLAWDLYNEPGNCGMGNQSLPLLEAAFTWARQTHPDQPLTAGIWNDGLADLNRRQLDLSDVVSFHAYTNLEGLEAAIARYKSHERPVICTEWMARPLGARIETDLPLFAREGVGCYAWGLVNGRMQCQFPWWSKRGDPEPALWFHDLLRADGTPYDPAEVAAIQHATVAPGVPRLRPAFDFPVRDTCVCLVDGTYYLTGTTGHPTWWKTNEGVRIWRSADLKTWEPLGLVWSLDRDATWQKPVKDGNRALWAPELHYLKGTFWIAYCINYPGGGTGLLKSTTGKPEGPYMDVKPDGPLTSEIDASLFQDDDGKVYFVYQNGKIATLTHDMTGLAEEPRLLKPANADQVGFEGAFLFKANGRYYLSCADFVKGEYHCMVAGSDKLMGPYGPRYLAIPHGGHNMFFRDKAGDWWSTFFGNDPNAPFRERPAMLRIEFGLDGHVRPMIERPPTTRPAA
jgi:xylan 1,4-beta-xylosidase